jgi:hypothetical protein
VLYPNLKNRKMKKIKTISLKKYKYKARKRAETLRKRKRMMRCVKSLMGLGVKVAIMMMGCAVIEKMTNDLIEVAEKSKTTAVK